MNIQKRIRTSDTSTNFPDISSKIGILKTSVEKKNCKKKKRYIIVYYITTSKYTKLIQSYIRQIININIFKTTPGKLQ